MENKSGIYPIEYKVLLLPEKVEEKTEGGIFLPDKVRDQEEMAQVRATLIAMGGDAFKDMRQPLPKLGDRVYVAKYAGFHVEGLDKEMYQVANDKDIIAIIREG
jgi:co-chaperonin GroES (HSP10)